MVVVWVGWLAFPWLIVWLLSCGGYSSAWRDRPPKTRTRD